MDTPDISSGRSPRRELQGPRPTPLKLRKDSHKIRKPPVAPPPAEAPPHHPYHPLPRPPVIIYTVSPKIIHANPNEFMSVVQRLTGPNSTCTNSTHPSSSSSVFHFQENNGGSISPAARFASIEKTKSPDGRKTHGFGQSTDSMIDEETDQFGGITVTDYVQRTGNFPGILSPNPNTLPPIPPNFFSPHQLDNYNYNYTNNNNRYDRSVLQW
ncbi:hypothetical protein OROMI_030582 [Orobanche minor]